MTQPHIVKISAMTEDGFYEVICSVCGLIDILPEYTKIRDFNDVARNHQLIVADNEKE